MRFFQYEFRTTDTAAARAFYAEVLGEAFWNAESFVCLLPAAAIARGARPHWLGHVGPCDVEAMVSRIVEAGGTQLGPSRADDAILRDPFGAMLAVSQHGGGDDANTGWRAHHSTDGARAFASYADWFGWRPAGEVDQHRLFADSETGAAVGSMSDLARSPEVHPQWLYFYRVDDLDAALAKVRSLGGLTLEPVQMASGDVVCACDDAQGAAFGLFQGRIERAAKLLRAGRLVAFPTETVYGLGANALDAAAVERIFEAKGRPKTSPLIVHVTSIEMAQGLALEWPPLAERLARAFWPGPLTLVVKKRPEIPGIVTAGLDTVGLRMPAHPVAMELLRAAGIPVAAPSANRFTELSPVTAEHVRESLGSAVDLILDGGTCRVGIESTVLSVAGPEPLLLRPGIVSAADLEAIAGPVRRGGDAGTGAHQSPGQHQRHYRPRKPLVLVGEGEGLPAGSGAYLWWSTPREAKVAVEMPRDAVAYAARLYGTLHELDHRDDIEWIAVERVPAEWDAVGDRLQRAAVK